MKQNLIFATLTTKVEKTFMGMKELSLVKVYGCRFAFFISRAFSRNVLFLRCNHATDKKDLIFFRYYFSLIM